MLFPLLILIGVSAVVVGCVMLLAFVFSEMDDWEKK